MNRVHEKSNEAFFNSDFVYKLDKVHFSIFAYDSPAIKTIVGNLIELSFEMNLDTTLEVDCICILKKGIIFKKAYPGLDGGLADLPKNSKPYIYKSLEFESLAYFLIQLQREYQWIRHITFDMAKYAPDFSENWQVRFLNPSPISVSSPNLK